MMLVSSRCGAIAYGVIVLALAAHGVTLENADVVLSLDDLGRVASIREKATGRELVGTVRPFAMVRGLSGKRQSATKCEGRDGLFTYSFAGFDGEVALRVTPFAGGWTFAIERCTVRGVKSLALGEIAPACNANLGVFANLISDGDSAVCLRAYDIPLSMLCDRNPVRFWVETKDVSAVKGLRFGLAAGPRGRIRDQLKAMTVEAGVPKNEWGGAWSVGCPALRGSYLQPRLKYSALDRWIELAERGGFGTIHLRQWMTRLGHYEPDPKCFPGGWTDVSNAVRRIHAAGLACGVHTLTACISPDDAWATGESNRDLLAWRTYTLAEDLAPDATSLVITERPATNHDTAFTYFGNGNVLRIGSELISYTGVDRDASGRFTGLERGSYGSRAAAHAKGETVAYLQQRYRAFYPVPDSALADAVASGIGAFYRGCGFDQIYMDGSEGMMDRCGIDTMRRKIFAALGGNSVVEASCSGAHNWWFHSRTGAWDGPNYDFKGCFDLHVRLIGPSRETDLLEPQMGWWYFRAPTPQARGQFLDDLEYFAAHNAGLDASMSLMAVDVNEGPLSFYRENAVTVLGWYERFRLGRAFRPEVLRRFREPKAEFRLRQDARGAWTVAPVVFSDTGAFDSPDERDLEIRFEPLYSNGSFDRADRLTMFDPVAETTLTAARGVEAKFERTDGEKGAAIRLTARNVSAERNATWVLAAQTHMPRLAPSGRRGIGFWVKGDGSGAVLDFQLKVAREYGGTMADFVVPIDFTGWRFIDTSIRERTVDAAERYVWPDSSRSYRRYLSELNMLQIAETSVRLNGIEPGKTVAVEVGPVTMVHVHDATFAETTIEVNGKSEKIPFAIKSGEFAVRDARFWTHYSGEGDPLRRVPAASQLKTCRGVNRVSFVAKGPDANERFRARISTFAVGAAEPALVRSEHVYEAATSAWFEPVKGFEAIDSLKVEAGRVAFVEGGLIGPIADAVLTVGGERIPLGTLAHGEERRFALDRPVSGVCPVRLTGRDAAARLRLVKRFPISKIQ